MNSQILEVLDTYKTSYIFTYRFQPLILNFYDIIEALKYYL